MSVSVVSWISSSDKFGRQAECVEFELSSWVVVAAAVVMVVMAFA